MKFSVLTLFPEIYSVLNESIIGKALEKNAFFVNIYNIRDFSTDKHKKCDDTPFGGGAGMVMTPQPIYDTIKAVDEEHSALRIYLSPKGKVLNQALVKELSKNEHILLLNGSYEGIDQRILDSEIDMEISIGDYILTSGDLGSLVLINSVARYIPNVLGSTESTEEESFSGNLLEYPHYTRPQQFNGVNVPDVLLSGNHKEIAKWRKEQSVLITKERRPELLATLEEKK